MNGKIFVALLLIIPLLTVTLTAFPDADASKGDSKSCSKDKSMKSTYNKNFSKLADKIIKKQQI